METDRTREAGGVMSAVANACESIVGLPAVATLEWCDRGAWCLAGLVEPALAVLTIGTLSPIGDLTVQEVSGVAARAGTARARPIRRGEPEYRGEDPRIATLRVRAARFRKVGIKIPTDARTTPTVGRLVEMPGGEAVTRGDIPRLFNGLDASDVLVGILGLGDPTTSAAAADRVLIAQIAPLGSTNRMNALHPQALAAVMPVLARRALLALGDGSDGPTRWLTDREQIVLEQLTLGKSVRQIADELERSPHTVHDHVKSLHRKLNANSRGELVARALGHTSSIKAGPGKGSLVEPKPIQSGTAVEGQIETKPAAGRPIDRHTP